MEESVTWKHTGSWIAAALFFAAGVAAAKGGSRSTWSAIESQCINAADAGGIANGSLGDCLTGMAREGGKMAKRIEDLETRLQMLESAKR